MATKGFLVQVPKRLVYSMETVGDRPSLRFEVMMANSHIMYPADEKPTPAPGVKYERVSVANAKGDVRRSERAVHRLQPRTTGGKPKPKRNQKQFVGDAHDGGYVNVGIANILRGDPKTREAGAAETTRGTFILPVRNSGSCSKGRTSSRLATCPVFVANQGDIVYAPAQIWHRPRHVGTGMATRLAVVGYANSHLFQPGGE